MKRQKGEKVKRLMPLYLFASLPLYLLTFSPFLAGCAAVRPGPPVASDLTGKHR
ncbi:MAG: hypothetical protein HYW14_03480 [Planctomycetes bacterium]|nr:hypothetical protein [Planctomycetota bacterium]